MRFTDIEKKAILNLKSNTTFSLTKIYKLIRPNQEMSSEEFLEMMDITSRKENDTTEYITDYNLNNTVRQLMRSMTRSEIYTFLLSERICNFLKRIRIYLSRY